MTRLSSFVVTPRLPFPPSSGGDLRCWHTIEALIHAGPVSVFGIGSQPQAPPPAAGISMWVSTSTRSALEHLDEGGPTSWIQVPDWRPSDWYFSDGIAEEVAQAVDAAAPSLVVLDSLMTAGYLAVATQARAKTVLNAHNVESDLQRQLAEGETTAAAKMVRRRFAERTLLLEQEVLGRVDRVWTCSRDDQDLVKKTFASSPPVDVLPNVVDAMQYDVALEAHLSRQAGPVSKLVFPAQFAFPPNLRAARFLLEELLPAMVASRSGTKVWLVGRSPSEWMRRAAAESDAVVVTGFVEDTLPYLTEADAMVLPIFEGSGTRLKALEAMAAGLPMIATPKAVQGLDLEPGKHVLIAERVEDFAEAVNVLQDPETYSRLVREARALVEARYSPSVLRESVARSLEAIFGP